MKLMGLVFSRHYTGGPYITKKILFRGFNRSSSWGFVVRLGPIIGTPFLNINFILCTSHNLNLSHNLHMISSIYRSLLVTGTKALHNYHKTEHWGTSTTKQVLLPNP